MLEIWNKPQHARDVDNALARLAAALKVAEKIKEMEKIAMSTNTTTAAEQPQAAADLEQHKAAERVAGDPRDQAAQYLLFLRRFVSGNKIPRDLASRIRKAGEELGELGEAAVLSHYGAGTSDFTPDHRDVMSEAADLVNVAIDILMICADDGPESIEKVFPYLIYNLAEKAGKYDRGENRIGGRD